VLSKDNGGELCEKEFEEFYKKCTIARYNKTPYTPQKNGVVEIMNRNLMEKERRMLSGVRLGQEFWVKEMEIPCYLFNISP